MTAHCRSHRRRLWTLARTLTAVGVLLASGQIGRADVLRQNPIAPALDVAGLKTDHVAAATARRVRPVAFSEQSDTRSRDRQGSNPPSSSRMPAPRFPERYPLVLALLVGGAQMLVTALSLYWALARIHRMPRPGSRG